MNILPIINFGIINPPAYKKTQPSSGLKMSTPLAHDTVSFGRAKMTMADALEHQLQTPEVTKRMKRLSTIYLDIIESVATKLKYVGVSFDRIYCEQNPIKSPKAYISKVSRSGSFKVPDRIRATLYCSDIYNLSVLNDEILPAFADRGFVVAKTEVPLEKMLKKGYVPTKNEIEKGEVVIPDLDIRLYGVEDQITRLDSKYRYSISHPQDSGYEDIQIRFVRDYDDSSSPILHELIILPGKNFAKAKAYESKKIYDNTRQLDELNFIKGMRDEKSLAVAKRHISIIKSMLNLEISQKLFGCAKNIDVYNIDNNITLSLSPQDINVIKNSFADLRKVAREYYETIEARAKSPKRIKTIKQERNKDSQILTSIQKNILESIEFFNNTKSFKKLPDIS